MDDLTLLVIWIAFAIICYAIAKSKGRNEWIAFGVGLLFGVFAVAFYLIARGSKEYELKKAEETVKQLKGTK